MSTTMSDAGRPGVLTRAVGVLRAWARDPIHRRVVAVCLLGAALAAAALAHTAGRGSVLGATGLPAFWLLPGLIILTCLAEITVVRLRHGDAVEELSLYEAALIVDVLLLPPHQALIAATLGLVTASLIQRRPLVKALFNLGTYVAAFSGLTLVVHALGGTPGTMTAGVLLGVLLGTLVFTMVNLYCLAQILGVVNGVPAWRIVRSEARLSAYMAVGTVATGLTTVAVGLHTPMLLPFMAMPALALTYAYRAAAQEADERARSASLLELSRVLAEREDLVRRFLLLVRDAFDADLAVVVLDEADIALTVDVRAPGDLRTGPVPEYLAGFRALDRPTSVATNLPPDLRHLVLVPVEAGGRTFGLAALAVRDRRRGRLTTRDLTLLAPLANALAAAMSGAENLDRLVEETSKLQAIVEQSAEGIVMVDGAGVVRLWSGAFAELTGVPSEETTGRRLVDLLDVPDPDERALLMPVTPELPKVAVELTVSRRDGDRRHLRLAHSAIFDGGDLVRDVVVITDLTREHRTERLKSDFIATVSHELRTPLTPIMGYVNLLRTRGDRMPAHKRTQALDVVADRAAHLSRLVEDLLLASRVGDGRDEPALQVANGTHDLAAIVQQVVGDLATARIVPELPAEPVPAHCDAGRALQVVTNLVGNALKYSPQEAQVRVGMRVAADVVHVDVADHGRGIPADQLAKVFEKFHRVEDPMTMSTSGTGLGLFIARRLAHAMGGDISVESTLNVGSVFTLTLPRADSGNGGGPAQAAAPPADGNGESTSENSPAHARTPSP
ncbi:MAG TPA: ATP-binding protein [Pilimelia sp.]|nr:ATP-binding protein [Pilimelia sp.]